MEAHFSSKQQWWMNKWPFLKTWVTVSNRVYSHKLTDGAVRGGGDGGGRSGPSSCRISVTEQMLLGANIPLPHCFTCRNGQGRVWGVLDFCLWHQSMESKCFLRSKRHCYEELSWLLLWRLNNISPLTPLFLFLLFSVCGGNMEHKWLQ